MTSRPEMTGRNTKTITKLNLACGLKKKEGWINIDKNLECKPDVVHDLLEWIPFNNDSVDEILCEFFLEHLQPKELIKFVNDCHFVLKPGGKATFLVPNPNHKNQHVDPTHVKMFTRWSMDMFCVCDYNSKTVGIKGWWKPLKCVLTDEDITYVMQKVVGNDCKSFYENVKYLNSLVGKNNENMSWELIDNRKNKDR
jgi:SAM-dependent methyltransferase